ncbi:hypothetical protein PPUJ20066_43760 [Pseudomonas putida]|nr:hypothetical protein PPUJ20066_43760 [Pseudomonas putida]
MRLHQRSDALRVAVFARACQHQLAAGDQRPEALPHRDVETDGRFLHQHVAVVQRIGGLHPLQAFGQGRMGVAHALGLASGARGVDHIGQVVAVQVQAGGMAGPAVQVQLVEGDGADAFDLRQLAQQAAVAQQQAGLAVAEHVGQALGRVVHVQRHVGATGLEDGQQANQQLRRTLDGDGHAGIGANAFVTQVMGQAVGLLVQLGIVQAAALPGQRGSLRGQPGLLVELFDQQTLGRRRRCLAPAEQLCAVLFIEQLHLAQRQLRPGANLLQQRQQVGGQAFYRAGLEQFGGIVEGQGQAALMVLFTVQLQVELGFAAVPRQLFGKQTWQAAQRRKVTLLVVEHDLEQTLLARLGQGFEQLFERQVLVGLGLKGGLAGLGQQVLEGQAAMQLRTQHLAVDEEADQALGFQARAVGIGHADAQVCLAAVAVQHRLPAGQQHHEQARLLLAGQGVERFGQLGRHLQGVARRAFVTLAGARLVGAQVEHRQFITQLGFPVLQLAFGLAVGQPLPLPGAVVGVTQGQRRQRERLALAVGGVQFGELVEQNVQRPAIGDNVVQRHPQLVVFIVQARQGHAQQWALAQVERLLGLCLAARGNLLGGLAFEVQTTQAERLLGLNSLQGLATHFAEHRAQRFMARHQGLEHSLQCGDVQLTAQAQAGRNVVGRRLWVQLPQQPQAVLSQRLRQRLVARQGGDGLGLGATLSEDRGDRSAVLAQQRGFEQGTQAQVDAQLIRQARGGLGGCNGVAAQQQEVVVRRHGFDLEHIAPHGGDTGLQIICHRAACGLLAGLREARVTVEAAIVHALAASRALQLAAGSLGQRARVEQQDHGRRLAAGVGNDLAQGFDQCLGLEGFLHVAADLHRHADALLALVVHGKHRHAAFAQHVDFALQGFFQVLRVKVLAADDEHVFQAPGDKDFTLAHEAQVAGAQPGLAIALDERARAGLGVAPVAQGDARATGPDFTHLVVAQRFEALRLDDAHRMPGLRVATAHQHAAAAVFGAVGGKGFGVQR